MGQDVLGSGYQFMSGKDYEFLRSMVPIVCVDVLLSPNDDPRRVGLIRRVTPDGDGWCLIGGRVLRNEHLLTAVERCVSATLGPAMRVDRSTIQLGAVIEYFTERELGDFYDPQKHAVALTYAASCVCIQEPEALGEAIEFAWFTFDQLSEVNFGYGQGEVVAKVLKAFRRVLPKLRSSQCAPLCIDRLLGSRKLASASRCPHPVPHPCQNGRKLRSLAVGEGQPERRPTWACAG